jgi:isopentenyl phosphate kinase
MWQPVRRALDQGLVPLVYGDVALDSVRGGTIISTEEIFAWLAKHLRPRRIILAGVVPGVYLSPRTSAEQTILRDSSDILNVITPNSAKSLFAVLGGSHGTDVTGGMQAKVLVMCNLVEALSTVSVRVVSGEQPGLLTELLLNPDMKTGTLIQADGTATGI